MERLLLKVIRSRLGALVTFHDTCRNDRILDLFVERAREQLRREQGEVRRRFHRSQSPSVKKTVTTSGLTVGPIGEADHSSVTATFVYGDVSSDNDLNQLMFIIRNNYQIRVGVRFFSQSKFLHFSLTPFVQDKELISLSLSWALVVAPLVERLLLIPEIRGSNPVIGKLYITY